MRYYTKEESCKNSVVTTFGELKIKIIKQLHVSPFGEQVHGTLLVCSFHQIILIITKLFGETRTAHRNERKSRDFLRVKISRFTAVYDKT